MATFFHCLKLHLSTYLNVLSLVSYVNFLSINLWVSKIYGSKTLLFFTTNASIKDHTTLSEIFSSLILNAHLIYSVFLYGFPEKYQKTLLTASIVSPEAENNQRMH